MPVCPGNGPSTLNHPNIATVLGLEAHGGVHSIVLELVEGATLHDIITGVASLTGDPPRPGLQAVPVADAVTIALQIYYTPPPAESDEGTIWEIGALGGWPRRIAVLDALLG